MSWWKTIVEFAPSILKSSIPESWDIDRRGRSKSVFTDEVIFFNGFPIFEWDAVRIGERGAVLVKGKVKKGKVEFFRWSGLPEKLRVLARAERTRYGLKLVKDNILSPLGLGGDDK